jgi:hypothetical protein
MPAAAMETSAAVKAAAPMETAAARMAAPSATVAAAMLGKGRRRREAEAQRDGSNRQNGLQA